MPYPRWPTLPWFWRRLAIYAAVAVGSAAGFLTVIGAIALLRWLS